MKDNFRFETIASIPGLLFESNAYNLSSLFGFLCMLKYHAFMFHLMLKAMSAMKIQ